MQKKKGLSVLTPYLYIAPIAMILLTFVAGSLVLAIYFSFTKYNIITPAEFNGLYNYQKLFRDSSLKECIVNTLKMAVVIVPLEIAVSTLIAILMASRKNSLAAKISKAAFFVPYLSSGAVIGTVWSVLLNSGAPAIQAIFGVFGIDPTMLLGSSETAYLTVACIVVWKDFGYFMIITLSSLNSISDSYYEAAKVDGANSWQCLTRITLPLLKPTIAMNTFLSTIIAMQLFDIIYTLTGGGPSRSTTTLSMYAYQLTFKGSKAGYAMAVSNVLMLLVLIVVVFQKRFINRDASEI